MKSSPPPHFLYFSYNFEKKIGTVEAYVLKGVNEILSPVFFYFSSDFRKNSVQ